MTRKFYHKGVAEKFATYPAGIRKKLEVVRQLIFDVAASTEGVGKIEETLKWGEPSYVTSETHSGSTVRLDWKKSRPQEYAIYFNCKTTLVETFKAMYGDLFHYGGNRCIIFGENDALPREALADCIAMSLAYHLNKKGACYAKRKSNS